MDAVDDPAHGQQQLALFHGFFDQYQYFPNFITCAENQQFLLLALRHGSAHAALAADSDLETVVTRLRQAWPNVQLHVRGDAGYGLPKMYEVCERLGVDYTFGIAANAVLKKRSDELLDEAVRLFDETKVPQRLFGAFWYQAGSWPAPRWVIVKAEANAQGTNRRFVVSNRPGAQVLFEAAYDEYAMRGESENRNKEFACGMSMDRTSDHRFLANYFRLYLHAAALNLLVRLRREIAAPPPSPLPETPTETLDEPWRKKHANARRRTDPLGAGQPCTWRSLLIKVAAEVIVSSRRIVVRLSSVWPHLEQFRRVCFHVLRRSVTPVAQFVSSG
jgi:Transposase DDE domain group 1